jgi:hypothetical protein
MQALVFCVQFVSCDQLTGATCEKLTGLAVPKRLFNGKKALPLDEAPLDLTVVDRGVDGAPYVHFDVGTQELVISRQQINFDLGYLDAQLTKGSAKLSHR